MLVSFVALSSVAGGAVSRQRLAAQKAPAVPATDTTPAPAKTATAAPAPMRLVNAAFEGACIPKPTGGGSVDPRKVTGVVADGRIDSSDWADVRVRYAEEMGKGGPQSGKSCQRIDVDSVGFGSAQVEQAVHVVPGGTYRASLYVRASRPTKAELWLRNPAQPDKAFAMKVCDVGPTWQRYRGADARRETRRRHPLGGQRRNRSGTPRRRLTPRLARPPRRADHKD